MNEEPLLLEVDGMYCGSCARAVEGLLRGIFGVTEARVGFTTGVASLWLSADADRVSVERDALAITKDLGYPTRRWSPVLQPSVESPDDDTPLRIAIGVFLGMWVMAAQLALYTGSQLSEADALLLARVAGVFATPIVFVVGRRLLTMGWRTLRAGVPGMDTLVSAGTLGAWSLSMISLWNGSSEVWFDSSAMLVVFLLVGRAVETRVREKGADAVRTLLSLTPERAMVRRDDAWVDVEASTLLPGDRIRVDPYTSIPIDGTVLRGRSFVGTQALTGESVPQSVAEGEEVLAGTSNHSGTLEVEVVGPVGQRRIDGIAQQVRMFLAQRTESPSIGDRVAAAWFPVVMVLATLTLVIGSATTSVHEAVLRALAVLVITCPCALSVASPLVTAVAIGRAARRGILFRDPDALRRLATVETVAFDKTGTLTVGRPEVVGVDVVQGSRAELLSLARRAQQGASHPLADALRSTGAAPEDDDVREQVPGLGVVWPAASVRVGARRWFDDVPLPPSEHTEAWVERAGILLGRVRFADRLLFDAIEVVQTLAASHPVALWSGDGPAVVHRVAEALCIEEVLAGASPEAKAERLHALQGPGDAHPVVYVGDGINDAPVMAAAAVGIAIGGAADAAKASASVVLSGGGLQAVLQAIDLAKAAQRTTRRALIWAALYNSVALPAAMMGLVRPHWAVLAMVASSLSVTLAAVFSPRSPSAPLDPPLSQELPGSVHGSMPRPVSEPT